jgi:hypothetical protein
MKKTIPLLFAASFCFCAVSYGQSKENLFKIERNKNANIVQYDANVDSGGSIDKEAPLDAYWVMLAKDGRREEISAFEKRAYGYKISYDGEGYFSLSLNAVKDKKIKVAVYDGAARAQTDIDGKKAYLSKVYVFAKESGIIPKVLWYTLTGIDVQNGAEVSEKIEVSSDKTEKKKEEVK